MTRAPESSTTPGCGTYFRLGVSSSSAGRSSVSRRSACFGQASSTDTAVELACRRHQPAHRRGGRARLDPGVECAVRQHPDHVRAPHLQAAVPGRQHGGAVGGQPDFWVGVAGAAGPAPAGLGVDRADLPAAADVGIHRDGVVVDVRDAAQLEVTRVAPQRVSGGRVAALDLATVTGDHAARHHQRRGGLRARRRPQLPQ